MTPYYIGPPLINIQSDYPTLIKIPVDYPTFNELGPAWEANPNNPDHWIYNQEVGWREKTWEERQPSFSLENDFLTPVIGEKILRPAASIPATVVKYGLYLAGGLGLAWAASSVALAIYDGVERLVT